MSLPQNSGYLPALFQWLSVNKAPYARILEAFEAELKQEQDKLSVVAQSALLHPEDRAVGCVAFGRVEMLQEIVQSLQMYQSAK